MYSMIDNISGTNHAKALLDTLSSIVVVRYIKLDLVTWTRWVFINTICPKPNYKYIDTHTKEKYSSKYYKRYIYLFGTNIL